MCCFTGKADRVSDTRIFARFLEGGRQALVYEMTYAAASELAMVLPLPVPARSPEDAVRFVDLSAYPAFFADVQRAFDLPAPRAGAVGRSAPASAAPLVVHDVGNFEASFLPSAADCARLDPRFRLPAGFLTALPVYADWGFAVFKLKAAAVHARRVHPMAFHFPNRCEDELFFPTVHLHDGRVEENASFDHTLYLQAPPRAKPLDPAEFAYRLFRRAIELPGKPSEFFEPATPSDEALALLDRVAELDPEFKRVPRVPGMRPPVVRTRGRLSPLQNVRKGWEFSRESARRVVREAESAGLVALNEPFFKLDVGGWLPNADVWVPVPPAE
jgi:hypothetical protein